MKQIFIVTTIVLASICSFAARINVDYFKKYYVSEKGFQLHVENTNWIKKSAAQGAQEVVFQLKPDQKNNSATLTIRIDEDPKSATLEDYVKLWIPKFSQFGLDVQNYQYFKMKPELQTFIVDLTNSNTNKLARQFIFYKNKKAVIFTCMDKQPSFRSTVQNCNDLIKSFNWVSADDKI